MITNTLLSERSPQEQLPSVLTTSSESQQYYLTLLHSLPLEGNEAVNPVTTLGITSCYAGEGVTTVAVQLAMVAAASGLRVLLVDSNFAKPTLAKTFDLPDSPGLMEALSPEANVDVAVQALPVANLFVLTAGGVPANAQLIVSMEKMHALIRGLQADYELIIFDLPAAAKTGTDMPVARLLDGIVLVVEAERVRWEVATRVQQLLVRSGATVLGAVLNKRRQHIPNWLYRTL